jgi:hypothetical protein
MQVGWIVKRFLLILMLLCPLSGVFQAAGWATVPMSQRLPIGKISYFAAWLHNQTYQQWVANHYQWIVCDESMGDTTTLKNAITYMKGLNPYLKAYRYSIHVPVASINQGAACGGNGPASSFPDSVSVRRACVALGINQDSVYLWTNDSTVTIAAQGAYPVTTGPNSKIVVCAKGHYRVALDYRYAGTGTVLGWIWHELATAFGCTDGVMVDEESPSCGTGESCWDWSMLGPWEISGQTTWTRGDPRYSLKRNWPVSYTTTRQYGDSLIKARAGWMVAAQQYLAGYNMEYIPNTDGALSSTTPIPDWPLEGKKILSYAKGILIGESDSWIQTPSRSGNGETACNNAVKGAYDFKDSVGIQYFWPIVVRRDLTTDMTEARTRMNALGHILNLYFPGVGKQKFGPDNSNYMPSGDPDNMWYVDDENNWCDAMAKYFGYPRSTRDTATTGTDGASQTYTIHKITLASANGVSDTLTLAIGRYMPGTNVGAASAVSVTLPAGTWYQLNDDGTWSGAGPSVTIRNGEWKIFSSNTSLSDNGLAPGVPEISSVLATNVTTTTASIGWYTSISTDSNYVDYGPTQSYGSTAADVNKSTTHSTPLSGLPVNTTINVRVRSYAGALADTSSNYSFNTLAAVAQTGTSSYEGFKIEGIVIP